CYQAVKDAGRYRECKRTQGISTTELVGRMLLMTRDHHKRKSSIASVNNEDLSTFSSSPSKQNKVVYVDGTFDLFHVGHIEFLKRAKALGDYLLVGVHDDQYVDEVIIGAPYSVDDNVLSKVYIVDIVAHGNTPSLPDINNKDPYELPKKKGIYVEIENPSADLTTDGIIDRIIKHHPQISGSDPLDLGRHLAGQIYQLGQSVDRTLYGGPLKPGSHPMRQISKKFYDKNDKKKILTN
ncbi:8554_t:CDS:2, partial [Racocetra fulgida]